jgi:hypothetical protein
MRIQDRITLHGAEDFLRRTDGFVGWVIHDLPPASVRLSLIERFTRRRIVSSGSRRAFVASSIHILAIGRLMQTYHEAHHEVEVHIFLDRGEALTWLGMKDDSGLF